MTLRFIARLSQKCCETYDYRHNGRMAARQVLYDALFRGNLVNLHYHLVAALHVNMDNRTNMVLLPYVLCGSTWVMSKFVCDILTVL